MSQTRGLLLVLVLLPVIGVVACGQAGENGEDNEGSGGTGGTETSGGTGGSNNSTTGSGGASGPSAPVPPAVDDYEQTCAERAHEACYYVSSSGSFPPDTEGHQLSLAEVSSRDFSPGDIILFARGDTWRTYDVPLVTATSSGSEQEPIVYSAFGEGTEPRLFGSIRLEDWSNTTGDLWESSTEVPSDPSAIDSGAEIFFETSDGSAFFGHHESSIAGLDREGDWIQSGTTVTVFSPEDPGVRYASVEAPQARRLIALANQQYLVFDSLVLRYMVNAGLYDVYGNAAALRGLTLSRSEIAYIGVKNSSSAYGLSLERSDVLVTGNDIHDCGRRGVSLVLYSTDSSTISDVVIENNHFHHGYHTTGVDIQSNQASSGAHLIENVTIRNNVLSSDPDYDIQGEDGHASNLIFINQDDGSQLRNIYIYGNSFFYAPGSGIKLSGGENYLIHHNTFYGFNPSYDNYQAHIFGGTRSRDITIENNIFWNDASDSRYACIEIAERQAGEYTIDHNLYFASAYEHSRLLWVDGGTSWFFDDDFDAYVAATGFDENSPVPGAPQFADAPTDLRPTSTSPAVGAGVAVDWIMIDQRGEPMNDPPDLGALQSTD